MELLRLPRAKAFAQALRAGAAYARFVECRCSAEPETETVIFEVEPETPQRPIHDIRSIERVAITFEATDLEMPEVQALRSDFPLVPHLNLKVEEFPRSLCLYDEPWRELQLRWTPAELIDRLREWLAKTARNELHADDQPLEPLLLGSPWTIVVPKGLLHRDEMTDVPAPFQIIKVDSGAGRSTLIATVFEHLEDDGSGERASEFVATTFTAKPQPHGIIRKQPTNLDELVELLAPAGINLLHDLRSRLQSWQRERVIQNIHKTRLVLVIDLPKVRTVGGNVEDTETWAFIVVQPIAELGEQIGVWKLSEGVPGQLLVVDETKWGDRIDIGLLNPTEPLTRERAARLGGFSARDGRKISAIGLGALGSQVFFNLIRTGFGEWMLIDRDLLFPHNLARHALFDTFVGNAKVYAVAFLADHLIAGDSIARSLVADVLDPGDSTGEVGTALREAEVILDMSASVAVARHLARDADSAARRVSLFLSPSGTDSVLLAEDAARTIPLDLLEMQYYRQLTRDSKLANHLQGEQGAVRYGVGCRDRSGTIPQDLVALHAANGSRALRTALTLEDARITILKTDSVGSLQPSQHDPTLERDWLRVRLRRHQPPRRGEHALAALLCHDEREAGPIRRAPHRSKWDGGCRGVLAASPLLGPDRCIWRWLRQRPHPFPRTVEDPHIAEPIDGLHHRQATVANRVGERDVIFDRGQGLHEDIALPHVEQPDHGTVATRGVGAPNREPAAFTRQDPASQHRVIQLLDDVLLPGAQIEMQPAFTGALVAILLRHEHGVLAVRVGDENPRRALRRRQPLRRTPTIAVEQRDLTARIGNCDPLLPRESDRGRFSLAAVDGSFVAVTQRAQDQDVLTVDLLRVDERRAVR